MAVASTVSGPRAQIPNALTVARLLVIPVFAVLVLTSDHGYSWPAAIIFFLAGVTDQLDGYLARRWHVESAFGKIADPLADRLMIDVAVLTLWHTGRLPWIALLIPLRDVFAVAATPLLLGRGYRFEVNALGKLATWLLYASLTLVMIVHSNWPLVIFYAGLVLAVVSLAMYALKAWRETRVRPDNDGASVPEAAGTAEAAATGGRRSDRGGEPSR